MLIVTGAQQPELNKLMDSPILTVQHVTPQQLRITHHVHQLGITKPRPRHDACTPGHPQHQLSDGAVVVCLRTVPLRHPQLTSNRRRPFVRPQAQSVLPEFNDFAKHCANIQLLFCWVWVAGVVGLIVLRSLCLALFGQRAKMHTTGERRG